jgi:hypothetical protein
MRRLEYEALKSVPTVATVDGVRIIFYVNEHPPAHFHAAFAEHRAIIEIETLDVTHGTLPKAKLRAVIGWARQRRAELLLAWIKAQSHLPPGRIK